MTGRGLHKAVNLASIAALTLICTLTAWALLPLAFGLRSSVVMSGSMQPQINPGDIVVTLPKAAGELLPGQVISFTDPNDPARELTHQLVRVNPDGTLATRGTANTSEDSSPVTADLVKGQAVLRVPWAGLPTYWLRSGQLLPVGAFGLIVLVALTAATGDPRGPGGGSSGGFGSGSRSSGRRPAVHPTLHPSALPTTLPSRA